MTNEKVYNLIRLSLELVHHASGSSAAYKFVSTLAGYLRIRNPALALKLVTCLKILKL